MLYGAALPNISPFRKKGSLSSFIEPAPGLPDGNVRSLAASGQESRKSDLSDRFSDSRSCFIARPTIMHVLNAQTRIAIVKGLVEFHAQIKERVAKCLIV